MTEENRDLVATLETLVDKHNLLRVLTALELCCIEKAAHIRENWQDNLTARRWDQAAKAIYRALNSPGPMAVS